VGATTAIATGPTLCWRGLYTFRGLSTGSERDQELLCAAVLYQEIIVLLPEIFKLCMQLFQHGEIKLPTRNAADNDVLCGQLYIGSNWLEAKNIYGAAGGIQGWIK
jgi:hypothetical protein